MVNLKFGVFLPFYAVQIQKGQSKSQFDAMRDIIMECEKLHYDSVWLDDHLMYKNWPIFETWTTLGSFSSLTNKLRLGTMVSCNYHRNPGILAKTAATFDILSQGRLEFGIGAGIQKTEHIAYGFDFPKLSIRIERLAEALEIIKELWKQEKATYKGKYYSLKDAVCEPKPLQKPHPPITVAGSGEKHSLKITAKYADRFDWGFVPSFELYRHKIEVLEHYCLTIGRDFREIEKSCWPAGQLLITNDRKELKEKILETKNPDTSLEDFNRFTLAETPDDFMERLMVYVELGVTYFMLYFADLPKLDSLRLFSEAIIKKM